MAKFENISGGGDSSNGGGGGSGGGSAGGCSDSSSSGDGGGGGDGSSGIGGGNGGGGSVVGEKWGAEKKCKTTRKRNTYSGYIIVMVLWFALLETVKPPLPFLSGVVEPELWVIWGNPCCMFFLLNIIVAILALKSGMFANPASQNGGLDFYAEFIKKSAECRAKYETVDSLTGAAGKYGCSQSDDTKVPSARKCSRSERLVKNRWGGRCKGGGL